MYLQPVGFMNNCFLFHAELVFSWWKIHEFFSPTWSEPTLHIWGHLRADFNNSAFSDLLHLCLRTYAPRRKKTSGEIQSVCPANGLQGSLACGLADCIFSSFHGLNAPKPTAGTAGR